MKDKVVVITGASSGIGKALAYEFSGRGATVVLGARSQEKLEQIRDDIRRKGGRAEALQTDVSVENDCKNLILLAIQSFGQIDVLINNAGISMRASFDQVQMEVLHKLMEVNFWGTVYCTKYALPFLKETSGSLVGVSSIAGFKGLPGRTGYSASKFALQGFLETVRIENLKKGIHVMIACPGFTSSNIRNTAYIADGTQQGESPREEEKMMSAEEVAARIEEGVRKRKRTVIMTTQGKLTVLLNKFFPAYMDKLVYDHMAKEPGAPLT